MMSSSDPVDLDRLFEKLLNAGDIAFARQSLDALDERSRRHADDDERGRGSRSRDDSRAVTGSRDGHAVWHRYAS